MRVRSPDRFFFILIIVLAAAGFVVFSSAALGIITRDDAGFTVVAGKQLFVLLVGLASFLIVASLPYHWWEKWARICDELVKDPKKANWLLQLH